MRDPGRPRRNPFFEHGSDGGDDDPGIGWRDAADPAPDPESGSERGTATDPGGGAFTTLLAVVEALGDAQPEAAEHLVAAAHEVVLTVKVLVDATEAALADQRAAMAAARSASDDDGTVPREPGAEVTDLTERRRAEPESP